MKNNQRSIKRYYAIKREKEKEKKVKERKEKANKKLKEQEEKKKREEVIIQRIVEKLKLVTSPDQIKKKLRVHINLSDIFGSRDHINEQQLPNRYSRKVWKIIKL